MLLAQGGGGLVRHAVQKVAHGVAHQGHVFQVHARFRLVKQDQVRLLGHKLQQFGAFDFPAGKTGVDVPVQNTVKVNPAGQIGQIQIATVRAELRQAAGGQPVDGGGPLKGHADAHARPFVHGGIGDVLALVNDAALGHRVARNAHDSHEQRGFAGTVGAEQDERFARRNAQVDAVEDRRVAHAHMQIVDFKHRFPRFRQDIPAHRSAHGPGCG